MPRAVSNGPMAVAILESVRERAVGMPAVVPVREKTCGVVAAIDAVRKVCPRRRHPDLTSTGMINNLQYVRYPREHKDRVRERIVRAAARQFRGRGSGGVAIAELMGDLKLTHGGFYRHFRGKEHLFDEAFLAAAAETRARLLAVAEQAPAGRELDAIISTYLSSGHCRNPAQGCPIAALAGEFGRRPKKTRATLDRAVLDTASALARFMWGETPAERQQNAVVLFAGMAGTMALARAVGHERLRDDILATARRLYLEMGTRRI